MKLIITLIIAVMAWMIPFYGSSQIVPCTVTLTANLGGTPPVPPTYTMTNGNISTCSGVFYDPGGTGNYANSIGLITMTFCSDQPGEQIILDFSAYGFQVETSFDFLNIYDGTGTGGTQLWNSQTSGGSTNPGVITSTTGCLTITFSSDGSVTYQGWGADISCTNAPTAGTFDCNGGPVSLAAVGQGQQTSVMSNNFNAGLGAGWVSTGGSAVGSPCGPSLDGTDYYWASTSTGTPNLTTVSYDVSCGGTLTFDMAYATQGGAAPCEGPDLPNEGVTLQYSTDGGVTWTVIQYWDPNGGYDPQMTAWGNYSIPIPAGAQTPGTQFQWIQNNSSGTCCDNWGIDNVMITANTNCNAYWYDYNNLPSYPDPQNQTVTVTSTTTFGVWYTNGTDSCYAATTVIVPPGTTADAGPDQTICASGNVTIGAAPVTPDNGATYTWSTGATGTISGGVNGQVTVSPAVTTEYYLTVEWNGCFAYDTVTVFVDAPPTASNPAPINVQCSGDVPLPNPLVVTDENDDITIPPAVAFLSDVSDGLSCPETITRTYRVTDACGNFVDVQQTITINDTQAPVMAAAPGNASYECNGDVPAMAGLGWTDNCDGAGTVAGLEVSDGLTCPETITRTWTYTDACGNTATETQTITVQDTQAPILAAAPANATYECNGDVPALTDLSWTDNCDGAGTVAGNDVSDGLTCPETITRTWTYTDVCGNTATETQTITVQDTQAPVFAAAPANVTVECAGDVPAMTNLGWTDNCDGAGSVAGNDVSDGFSCPETITRTWTYTDACGNNATVSQTIIVDDTTPPTASNPAPISIAGVTPIPPADPLIVNDEADNCTVNPVVAWVSDVSDNGNCPEIITRTYSVTDDCGNQILVTQLISIGDAILPTASNPAPINVQCSGNVPLPDPLVVTDESDNGAMPIVTFESDASDGLSCPETITRTYRVTDDCGNFIFVTQTITVHDTQVPVFAAPPANVTVECIGDVPAMTNLGWTDNCDGTGNVTGSDVSDGLSCPETITRTWTYTDVCGNTATETQTITVIDTQAPVFAAAPANVTVECIGDVPAMANLGWTDNCDGAGNVTGADVSDGLTCPEIITRTWTYTDACGNTATETQTITVIDTQAPVFAAPPANVTVECAGDVPAMTNLGWTDNCDGAGNVTGADVSDGLSCPETITRTWTYTDACGNNATVSQTIIVDDTTPPTASNPATTTITAGTPIPPVDPLVVNDEADNCTANPVVTFVSEVSDNNPCPETITRIYEITDDCGNTTQVTHLVVVTDPVMPTGTAPAPINVECIGDVPAADPLLITDEADNQGVPVVAHVGDVSDGLTCPETITRTYSITDVCGNQITVDQIITVQDVTAPVMAAAPANVTVECIGDVPAMINLGWTDNCDGAGTVAGTDVSDGLSCPETITRTWTYTDACGNTSSTSQTITVIDTQAPVFAPAPADITISCTSGLLSGNVLTWTDNCDGTGAVLPTDGPLVGGTCGGTITRTWTYTDNCGNNATVTQTITVNDTQAPVLDPSPANVTVQCIGDVPAMIDLGWTDNCDGAGIVTGSDVSDGLSCPETITRTWTYTDNCGNTTTTTQTIVVDDTTPPTASNPTPISVPGLPIPNPDPTVVTNEADNCTVNPIVAWVSDVSDGNVCNGEIITRTYSITDDCGNQTLVTQEITILATPAPIDAGNDTTICLGENVTIVASNPWGAQLSWSPQVPQGPFAPTQTTTYTVTADNYGCISSDQITVTVEEPPVVSFMGDVLSGCSPLTVNFTNTSTATSGIADCEWTINGTTLTGCNPSYTFNNGGTYDVTLATTSTLGCTSTDTYSQYIYVEDDPIASFIPSATILSSQFTGVNFENTSSGATSYQWDFGTPGATSTDVNASHTYPEQPGTYNVTLTAYTDLGCMDEAYATIVVEEQLVYYIPNTFTPDGDDYNETFLPVFTEGYDPFDFHLLIFNRWGEIIWESYDASVGWDGTYGTGGLVQDGTYNWKLEFKVNMNDERKYVTGHVNLIR
ncbi:PKD domain-containing protein [Crocinitomicaceae bacterium]|nr:PKD domain-containing protein [Crocinitomicaceae bacterium]